MSRPERSKKGLSNRAVMRVLAIIARRDLAEDRRAKDVFGDALNHTPDGARMRSLAEISTFLPEVGASKVVRRKVRDDLRQVRDDLRERSQQVPRRRTPTVLEQRIASYLLRHSDPISRRALTIAVWTFGRAYGEEPLLRILSVAVLRRDRVLALNCLRGLLNRQNPNVASDWGRQLSKEGVGPDSRFIAWRGNTLLEQVRICPTFQPPGLIAEITSILNELMRAGSVEQIGFIVEALAAYAPDEWPLLLLRAHCKKWSNELKDARLLYEKALEDPGCNPTAFFDLSEVLEFLGDDEGSIAAARRGHDYFSDEELFLDNPGYMTMPAGSLMGTGDLVAGWQCYQKRRDRFVFEPPPNVAIWEGEKLEDDALLLIAEKGIGDEIRYASCYPDLVAKVRELSASADPRLVPLLQRSFPEVRFIPAVRGASSNWRRKSMERDTFKLSRALSLDLYCLAMQFDKLSMAGDLPLYLRRERTAFPRHAGYLVPDPAKREVWRARLDELGPGLKVGFTWRSASQNYKRDQHYFAIEQMLPILKAKGVHFVNLQYDSCEDDLAELESKHGLAVHRWQDADLKNDLDGVAALIKELDLVIAPHTMVKELSGAVGTPTLLMAPTGQAWVRWRADPESSEDVWHPSVKHVQSERAGDKADVIDKTADTLKATVEVKGISREWRQASTGLHLPPADAVSQQAESEETSDKAAPLQNDYGEIYVPVPTSKFVSTKERNIEWRRRSKDFDRTCGLLMGGLDQPAEPKGVLLDCSQGSQKQRALTAPGARGLLERGWSVVPIDDDPPYLKRSKNRAVRHFHNVLSPGLEKRSYIHRDSPAEALNFPWEIDWDARICSAEGINFFPILANRLGKEFRRYNVSMEDPKVADRLKALIGTCDAALRVCLDVEERLVPLGLPVRITGFEPNYPATGVFKVYCAERGWRHGIEFVEIRQAYEKYFRAGRSGFVNMIEVENVTCHKLYSSAGLRGDAFDAWLERDGKDESVARRGEAWATQNRSGSRESTIEGKILLERIQQHRARGGRVACLYGCIPFDFGHPWSDHGPAHSDLADWYNHTVEVLNGTDVMLLVKPHPSEADFEQFGRPEEFFVEMLKIPTERNISLLGHRWLNNSDLYPHLDFGIVWRGSIAIELSLLGIPVVVSAPYSMADHVIDLQMPTDRADYEDMLRTPGRIKLNEEVKWRAARVFEFYRTQCMIKYPFGWISAKRREGGPPVLSEGAIKAYLADGHPAVYEICRRIIAEEDGYSAASG